MQRRIGPDLNPAARRPLTKTAANYTSLAMIAYLVGLFGSTAGMKAILRRKYRGYGLAPAREEKVRRP